MSVLLIYAYLFFIGSLFGWILELFYRRFLSAANPRINASIFQLLVCKQKANRVNCFQEMEGGANRYGENLQNISDLS